jgi:hypothetical protein
MSQPGVRSTIDRRLTTLNSLTCGLGDDVDAERGAVFDGFEP